MKYVSYAVIIVAIASIVYNAFMLDFSNILSGDSQIAVISIIAALCVVILMSILIMSYKIQEKQEN